MSATAYEGSRDSQLPRLNLPQIGEAELLHLRRNPDDRPYIRIGAVGLMVARSPFGEDAELAFDREELIIRCAGESTYEVGTNGEQQEVVLCEGMDLTVNLRPQIMGDRLTGPVKPGTTVAANQEPELQCIGVPQMSVIELFAARLYMTVQQHIDDCHSIPESNRFTTGS